MTTTMTDDELLAIAGTIPSSFTQLGIERELVHHYIGLGLFQKGIALIEARPIDSVEDNLLLVELYSMAGEEAKARRLARTLLIAGRDEDLVRAAWMKSFLHEWERRGAPPSGPHEYFFIRSTSINELKFDPVANGY